MTKHIYRENAKDREIRAFSKLFCSRTWKITGLKIVMDGKRTIKMVCYW